MFEKKVSFILLSTVLFFGLPMVDASFAGAVSFTRTDYGVEQLPVSVAVGDFNGDGIQDLAVIDKVGFNFSKLSILLGKGDGTFQEAHHFPAGGESWSLALGDFDGDGVLDVAVPFRGVYPNPGGVLILLGAGDGTFQRVRSFELGDTPRSIAVEDFNRDEIPDLAVVNAASSDVSILLGTGDARLFLPVQTIPVGRHPQSVAVGDFNDDNIPDLAVANFGYPEPGTVSILLGDGDGRFQPAHTFAVGAGCQSIAVGDFDGDEIPDLAVANLASETSLTGGRTVAILLGMGDGSFQPAPAVGVGASPTSVTVGDFNGDEIQDLAVTNRDSNSVVVLLGLGNGNFQEAETVPVGRAPWGVTAADFNGDKRLDLAVANAGSNTVSVLINDSQ